MYKTILVNKSVTDGQHLIEALDSRGFSVVAAFWYHIPDLLRWRLFIVTPMVASNGPLAAYRVIEDALNSLRPDSLSLGDISVLAPQEDKFQRMQQEMQRGGLWTTSHARGDVIFEDAYVYRL